MRQSHMRCWMIVLLLIVVIGALSSAPVLVHEEDFSDNQDGWFVDQRMAIRNGRYEFYSSTGAAYAWRTREIADGSLEVQAIWRGGLDSHGYGMIFRLEDELNYYFFWIAAQGYYIVGKAVDGKAEVFRSWTYEPVIAKRGTNTLNVDLQGSQIIYKINNQEIYRHTDSSFASGGYGFYTQKEVQAAFDNFKAWTEVQPSTAKIAADIVVKEAESSRSAIEWRDQVGKKIALTFAPSEGEHGTIWGTGIYTDDSNILTAAVHSSMLDYAHGGTVVIEILGPQDSFAGSTNQGVESSSYGYWSGSFSFVGAAQPKPEEQTADPVGMWQGATDMIGSNHMQVQNDAKIVGDDLRLEGLKKQYALITPGSKWDLTNGYTVSMRIKFNSWYNWGGWADNQYLIEYHTDAEYMQRLYIMRLQVTGDYNYATSAHQLGMCVGPIGNLVHTQVTPSLHTWHTITASYDGATMRMYLDGTSILEHPYRWTVTKSSLPVIVGAHHHGSSYAYHADVDIDSLFLFDRVLTTQEVNVLASMPNVGQSTQVATPPTPPTTQPKPPTPPEEAPATFINVAAYDQVPRIHTTFGTFNKKGTFGGSVYLKDIFNKDAYPAFIALYPVKRVAGAATSKDPKDFIIDGKAIYTATDKNGFYHLDLPNGDYIGVVYDADGRMYEFVSGDTVIRVTYTMKVHHFKIDNTKPTRTSLMVVDGSVVDAGKTVANLRVQAFQVIDLKNMEVAKVEETRTDGSGIFSFELEPQQMYILKAGVDESTWRTTGGLHGGTVIDLHFPEDSHGIVIPLEYL